MTHRAVTFFTSLVLVVASAGACKDKTSETPNKAPPAKAALTDATPAPPPVAKPPAADVLSRPFFYRAECKGKSIHLLGTFHLGVDAEKRLPPAVWQAFDAATTLAVEADLTAPEALTAAMRTDKKTLEDELGSEDWKKFEAAVGSTMAAGMRGMKASAAAAMLSIRGIPMTAPMDLTLVSKAKSAKKELVYLETASSQIALLDKWLDLRTVRTLLADLPEAERVAKRGLESYIEGDDKTLVELTANLESFKKTGRTEAEFKQMLDELLYKRNRAWVPHIEAMLEKGGGFVAVGAGHLLGPQSVVELLAGRGCTVTRLADTAPPSP